MVHSVFVLPGKAGWVLMRRLWRKRPKRISVDLE
jgi:hypothetical protein